MALDRANIFKLEKDFKEYEKNPFCDCFKSAKTFAEALKNEIETKELPHVLLLKATYGMGKTFFATRFTMFLRQHKKSPINTIYFSAWENDYCDNAFSCVISELSAYYKKKFNDVLRKALLISKDLAILAGITLAAPPVAVKIGIVATVSNFFRGKNLKQVNKNEINYIETKEHINKFKKAFAEFIKKLPNQRLVIIIDELDRCRPDYAMKILECIKHFFDIEGLFIIVPANEDALNKAYEALYGGSPVNTEWYFKKFFDDISSIKDPTEDDYKFIIEQYINEATLKNAIDSNSITIELNKFNSINTLVNSILNYSFQKGISYRDLTQACRNIAHICNILGTPIRVEYLSFYYIRTKTDALLQNVSLIENAENPLMQNGRYKFELLRLEDYFKSFNPDMRYNMPHPQRFSDYLHWINRNLDKASSRSQSLQSYSELEGFINAERTIINETRKVLEGIESSTISRNLDTLSEKLEENFAKIKQYQDKYGSDDDDQDRKNHYELFVDRIELRHNA